MKTLRLLFRSEYWEQGFQVVAQAFRKKHPAVDFHWTEGAAEVDSREESYRQAFQKNQPYDLVYSDQTPVAEFASQGWIQPLDDLFPQEFWEGFPESIRQACRWNGHYYYVPFESDQGLLYYRKDLLEQNGFAPPKTWHQLQKTAIALQKPPSLWGYTWQGAPYEGLAANFLEILWSYGGDWFSEDGKVLLDRHIVQESVNWWLDCLQKTAISPPEVLGFREVEGGRHFLEGQSIFHRNWPALWAWAERFGVQQKVGVTGLPASLLGGMGFSLSRGAGSEVKDFMRFCLEPEQQKTVCQKLGLSPSRPGLASCWPLPLPKTETTPVLSRPQHPAYRSVSSLLQEFVYNSLISGRFSDGEFALLLQRTKQALTSR